ncbi:MAG: hypothetical protein IT371_24990 [Deltaproteobacteria bacterium]|nr:hypothetical protein [Deltaproteobacteria bacterium]
MKAGSAPRRHRKTNVLLIGLMAGTIGAVLVTDVRRRASVVELRTPSGTSERCASCHEAGARRDGRPHPAIPGHADLRRFGCTPCHGGDGRRLDALAHGPAPGEGPAPFWPKAQRQLACARCHVPGGLPGAPWLDRAREEWLAAGCVGCHRPGGSTTGVGPDLRHHRSLPERELRELLLDPRRRHPESTMWRLTDQTYRGRFGSRPAGEEALTALIGYTWLLLDSPLPFRNAWARRPERNHQPCGACHRPPAARASGPAHRCRLLARSESLRCARCHATAATAPRRPEGSCPQVEAARPLCSTCHLRPGDEPLQPPGPAGPSRP